MCLLVCVLFGCCVAVVVCVLFVCANACCQLACLVPVARVVPFCDGVGCLCVLLSSSVVYRL